MTDFNDLTKRYRTDATFHQAVRLLVSLIEKFHLTPQEVRELGMFAAYVFELENPKPIRVRIPE